MDVRLSRSLWAVGALLSVVVAVVSYRYVPQIGPMAPNVAQNPFFHPWIELHAAGAATALLIGPLQFVASLRARRPRLHRWLGRSYVAGCLLGGVAGFMLALGATSGPVARAGFGTLAVLWILASGQAWRMATARRFDEHRRWMIRSFALTFAAVTLRLYLPLSHALGLDFLTAYRAISFLAWVPNLIAAEIYLARGRARVAQPA